MPPLIAAAFVVFLEGLSVALVIPVLTAYTQELGGGALIAGALFALATAPRVLTAPLWGRLSDYWGRRLVLGIVTVGTCCGSILWALAGDLGHMGGVWITALGWLVISRALVGVSSAQAVLGLAVASDVSTPRKRSASVGVLGASFGLAFALGPALGGWFAHSYSLAAVGWLMAGAQALSLAVIILLLRETGPNLTRAGAAEHVEEEGESNRFAKPQSLRRLAASPRVSRLLGVILAATVGYAVIFPTLQPLTERWYGFNLVQAGYVFMVVGIVAAVVQGGVIRPTIRWIGEKRTAALGMGLLAAGMGLLASHPGLAGFWIAAILSAIGMGLALPAMMGLLSLQVNPNEQGSVHGLNQSATSLGRAGGYVLGGALYQIVNPATVYLAGAAAGLVALLLLAHAALSTPRHASYAHAAAPEESANPHRET